MRAVQRFSTPAPDGVRLLQAGKVAGAEWRPPIMGSLQAFYKVIHRLREARALRCWAVVGDLPAGPRQTAFDWAPYADTLVLVVEPTWKSALTASRIARIARSRSVGGVIVVANKVSADGDRELVERLVGESVEASIPLDDAVATADRLGVALLDHAPSSPAVQALERLVEELDGGTVHGVRAP